MRDVLTGCHRAGIQLPGLNEIPEELIAWHDPRDAYPGNTVQAAYDIAQGYFRSKPDIIFVILPDRGKHVSQSPPRNHVPAAQFFSYHC